VEPQGGNYDESDKNINKDIHFGVAVIIQHEHGSLSFDWQEV
jgi:hypothetical protein